MLFNSSFFCKILLLFIFLAGPSSALCQTRSSKNVFPEFQVIQPNIQFWEKIYAQYGHDTAILHDNRDLSIIYVAVPLLKRGTPGASKINKKYLQSIKKTYRKALLHLATGAPARTLTEKKIQRLFAVSQRTVSYREASENLRFQIGLKENFRDGVIRSGAYIDEMKAIFNQYGLPEDLAYLPHVESSFNSNAYSRLGAAGAWQFTHSTGKQYLTINYTIDERRDIIASTHAAAQYLKNNLANLGTWPLAITAYNYGHHGMQRAINELGTYTKIFTHYQKGYFKFASRNFYAEFIAAIHIAKKLELSPSLHLDTPRQSIIYILPGFISAQSLCSHFRLNTETLKNYNPALRKPVWEGEKYVPKGYKLRLPANDRIRFLVTSFPSSSVKSSQKQSLFYTVRRGDTVSNIAKKHKVSSAQLCRVNNLNARATIYVGQVLHIPYRKGSEGTHTQLTQSTPVILKEKTKHKITSRPEKTSRSITPTKKNRATNDDYAITHRSTIRSIPYGKLTVQPGESLALYAEWLKISKEYIRKINGLHADNEIFPGQKLSIPFSQTTEKSFQQQRLEFHQEAEEDFYASYRVTGIQTYEVAPGDTLWSICQKKFAIPMWLLKKYNLDLQYNTLKKSQVLSIPIIEAI